MDSAFLKKGRRWRQVFACSTAFLSSPFIPRVLVFIDRGIMMIFSSHLELSVSIPKQPTSWRASLPLLLYYLSWIQLKLKRYLFSLPVVCRGLSVKFPSNHWDIPNLQGLPGWKSKRINGVITGTGSVLQLDQHFQVLPKSSDSSAKRWGL